MIGGPRLYSRSEAAEILKVSRASVDRAVVLLNIEMLPMRGVRKGLNEEHLRLIKKFYARPGTRARTYFVKSANWAKPSANEGSQTAS